MKSPAVPRGGDRPAVVNPPPEASPARPASPPHPGSSILRPELRQLLERIRPLAQSLPARQLLLLVEDLADFVALCAELRAAQRSLAVAKARKDWQSARLLVAQVEQLEHQVDEREQALRGEAADEDEGPPELGGPR